MDRQLEMTTELRRARRWILGVGIVMFVFDVITLQLVYGDRLPAAFRNRSTLYAAVVLAFFVAMWAVAKVRPVLGCVLALAGFWALHLYVAVVDHTSIVQGLLMKILFTLALIRGIKSASRAELLKKELAHIFD